MERNSFKGPKAHQITLKRLVIEQRTQPFTQAAMLTLKDGDSPFSSLHAPTYTAAPAAACRRFMQIHVDGKTLAEWDLTILTRRDFSERGVFYGFAEGKMLRLRLPPTGMTSEKQLDTPFRTIQLCINTQQEFHTAVSYLSKDVGLKYVKLAPAVTGHQSQAPYSSIRSPIQYRSPSASGAAAMRPPAQPASHVLSQRRQVPNEMSFARQPSQRPYTLTTHTPSNQSRHRPWSVLGTTWRQESYYPPLDLVSTDGSSQPRRVLNQSPVEAETRSWGPTQPYDQALQPSRPPSQTRERTFSRPVGQSIHESVLSQGQVDVGELSDQHLTHMTNRRGALVPTNRQPSSTLRNSSAEDYHHEQPYRSSSTRRSLAGEESQSLSRPGSTSEAPVPVKIQFLEPSTRHKPPYCNSKTMWTITINLPASTTTSELCFYAASHVNGELNTEKHVDGATLEARDKDGHVFDRQDDVSKAISGGETIFLAVSAQAALQRPHEESSLDLLNLYLASNPSLTPHLQASPPTDQAEQVPPPRKLPFTPRLRTGKVESTAQQMAPAQSPLAERPGFVNRSHLKAVQEISPPLSMNGNTSKVTGKKRPASRQSTSRQNSRRPNPVLKTSLASRELGEPARPSVPLNVTTRSATAQRAKPQAKGEHQQAELLPTATGATAADEGARIRVLAESSCMACRRKKFTCDRAMPECGRCVQDVRKCNYPLTRPKSVIIENGDQTDNNGNMDHLITSKGQPPGSGPVVRDIATQAYAAPVMQDATTQASAKTQDIAVQTEETKETSKDVEMKDAATNTSTTCIDAAVETGKCDDLWLPHSQSFELVSWAKDRYDEQLKKAADVLRTTAPLSGDYRDKVYLAAQYGMEFELELREMCEKAIQDSC